MTGDVLTTRELGRATLARQLLLTRSDRSIPDTVTNLVGLQAQVPLNPYLLEVRWLLREQAGHDVGDEPALEALAGRVTPDDSAANLGFVDVATEEVAAITPELIEQFRREAGGGDSPR